jgi:excinuclease ABC subunit A
MPQKKEYIEEIYSEKNACPEHGISLPELSARLFSFNSPYGACPDCKGLGVKWEIDPESLVDEEKPVEEAIKPLQTMTFNYLKWPLRRLLRILGYSTRKKWKELPEEVKKIILFGDNTYVEWEGVVPHLERRFLESEAERVREELENYIREKPCPTCGGSRLRKEALSVLIDGKSIWDIVQMPVGEAKKFFERLRDKLSEREKQIAGQLLDEIINRLGFLVNVGLDYLTLSRTATTLSGGEAQRIRLATQLGSKLTGVLYVLDEPSIGLHPRDTTKLINTLKGLRDLGNTVVVVEHDSETIESADWIIELGPGAGYKGGQLVAEGTVEDIKKNPDSLTGAYLSGRLRIEVPKERRKPQKDKVLRIIGAGEHNLKNIDVEIPLGCFVAITGVSGSGKSTLIYDILWKTAKRKFYKSAEEPGKHDRIEGWEHIDKVINVDQSPIGRTPRSNPATYTKIFDTIRQLFASTPEARARGWKAGRFSFNVKGGRCEACQGEGVVKVEMHFLPPVYVTCEVCKGTRYNAETLEVKYKGKNIAEVLDMTIEEAYEFFKNIPSLERKLKLLLDVGLGYLKLGQPAPTLSGGEAQRIKLARELSKKSTGRTLYLLDEPTTGLHTDDVKKLIKVLQKLVDKGNTVVVIEHNLDVIKSADWVIDLGPEGGEKGGQIVAVGSPEDVAKNPNSWTGKYLKRVLNL